MRSGGLSRGICCSATCTSRSLAGCGSGGLSASTSAISALPESRTCWTGRAGPRDSGAAACSGQAALVWRYAPSMADSTTSSITVGVPRVSVMAVIADFAAYPEWANGVRATEIVEQLDDDRSEERRVGKECRSRWPPDLLKQH